VDDKDRLILAALQEDARATYAQIAARAGLSPSSVHDRVRKMERAGLIRGYRAVVDPVLAGLGVAALVSVFPLDPSQPDRLPAMLVDFPEVEDCYSVAGHEDYVLKVRARNTADLEAFLRRLSEKGGVQTRSTVILSTPFEGRPLGL
jgi:Lrp/AsnC family leucine-responsive transcriptional regulator